MDSKLYRTLLSCVFALILAATPCYSQPLNIPPGIIGTSGDGAASALHLSSLGTLRIVSWNRNTRYIKVFERKSDTWSEQTIATSVAAVGGISITEIGGVLQFVFTETVSGRLLYARRIGSQWRIEAIDPGRNVKGKPSIAACGSEVCISYYDSAAKDLFLARGVTGMWRSSPLDSTGYDVGFSSTMTTMPNGRIAVASLNRTLNQVQVNVQSTSFFTKEYVSLGNLPPSPDLSLKADASGNLHLAFSLMSINSPVDLGLLYARRDTGGVWSRGTAQRTYTGGPVSLVLDSRGVPTIFSRFLRIEKGRSYISSSALHPTGVWMDRRYSPGSLLETPGQNFQSLNAALSISGVGVLSYSFTDPQGNLRLWVQSGMGQGNGQLSVPSSPAADAPTFASDGILNETTARDGATSLPAERIGADNLIEIPEEASPSDSTSVLSTVPHAACAPWDATGATPEVILQFENLTATSLSAQISLFDRTGRAIGELRSVLAAHGSYWVDIAKHLPTLGEAAGLVCVEQEQGEGAIRGSVTSGPNSEPYAYQLSSGHVTDQAIPLRHLSREFSEGTQQTWTSLVVSNVENLPATGELLIVGADGEAVTKQQLSLRPHSSSRISVKGGDLFGVVWRINNGVKTILHLRREEVFISAHERPKVLARTALMASLPRGGRIELPLTGLRRRDSTFPEAIVLNSRSRPVALTLTLFDSEGTELIAVPVRLEGYSSTSIPFTDLPPRRGKIEIVALDSDAVAALVMSESRDQLGRTSKVRIDSPLTAALPTHFSAESVGK